MKKIFLAFLMVLTTSCASLSEKRSNFEYLQNSSVQIIAGNSFGSGVMIKRGESNYVWTCGHVVENALLVEQKEQDGKHTIDFKFDKVKVLQELNYDGMKTFKESKAEVIKYSPTMDLALLKVEEKDFSDINTVFYLDTKLLYPLTPVYHIGGLMQEQDCISEGIVSKINVLRPKSCLDQTSTTVYPGSSGSGIYLRDDLRCIGIITSAVGESYNFMVPIRYMRIWAIENDVEWAINPEIEVNENLEVISKDETIDAVLRFLNGS